MGGKVAMEFATLFKDQTLSLAVLDIAPKFYPPTHLPILEAMDTLALSSDSTLTSLNLKLKEKIPNDMLRLFLLKNLNKELNQWQPNIKGLIKNLLQSSKAPANMKWEGPCLFIRGNASNYIQDSDITTINNHFTKTQHLTIQGGHWIHAENPKETLKALQTFLDENN